jgi:hypothetical protein
MRVNRKNARTLREYFESKDYIHIGIKDIKISHSIMINSILNFYNLDDLPVSTNMKYFHNYDERFFIYFHSNETQVLIGVNKNDYEKLIEYEPFVRARFEQVLLENIIMED